MKIKRGRKFECSGYDPWWVVRNIRHIIYKKYKKAVTDDLIEEIIAIIEQGE